MSQRLVVPYGQYRVPLSDPRSWCPAGQRPLMDPAPDELLDAFFSLADPGALDLVDRHDGPEG